MTTAPVLSLVIPVCDEADTLPELHARLGAVLRDVDETWEAIFVDDGSTDGSLAILEGLAAADARFKVLSLSRNFGQQSAITAGLDEAAGEAVVVLDADLQDPPEVIPDMLARWRAGADIVIGVRTARDEPWVKRATARAFYRVAARLVHVRVPLDAGEFQLISRRVLLTFRALRETHRFVRWMVAWTGFRQEVVHFARPARIAGKTKYPLPRMVHLALDGITSFSVAPLRIAPLCAALAALVAAGTGGWAVWAQLSGRTVPGWTALTIAVSLSSACQFALIGILGEYVGRIHQEVKRRPLYLVARRINLERPPDAPRSTEEPRP